jgi:ubiquinone biosynthesis monooxygenase Coq7
MADDFNKAPAGMIEADAAPPPSWRPGDARADARSMMRVDQAGEYGATRIYAGQLAVLGRHASSRLIARMAEQERQHLLRFDAMLAARHVRPTLLQPFWSVAGHALGAATALMSPRAAMACTAAVETEIDRHYSEQLQALGDDDPDLSDTIREFHADEIEHREAAIAAGAEETPGYPILSAFIRAGCRAAIALSKRF